MFSGGAVRAMNDLHSWDHNKNLRDCTGFSRVSCSFRMSAQNISKQFKKYGPPGGVVLGSVHQSMLFHSCPVSLPPMPLDSKESPVFFFGSLPGTRCVLSFFIISQTPTNSSSLTVQFQQTASTSAEGKTWCNMYNLVKLSTCIYVYMYMHVYIYIYTWSMCI